ncbi:GcvT family protein [Curvivirga aplysinae]|uniref:GcvT family protein n=1 Tax=Curvivirga aplysinae TaxID=2529852 RepID=UPI0012BB7843|nr:FAD-dependent oxidoreductase [Curvivirga aplysinae]MTI10043.1 FAD-dependent oxidoreductase [Curvivirga aplysinae]
MAKDLPTKADVVIVGGGIAGCSIAYHLTKIGLSDVVLLERKQLTSGTTWHAAGLVGQLRANRNMTELAKYTAELFNNLEEETGQATGLRVRGSVSLALHEERFTELKRGASMASNFGLEVNVIRPEEAAERWPGLNVEDAVGGVYLPADGQCNPIDTCLALAKGARMGGAKIFENTLVTKIIKEGGKAVGVMTEQGELRANTVVIAGGMWSRDLAAQVGANVPLHAAEHFYIVTEPMAEMNSNFPVLRVPDECAYYKEDAGKLMLGCFEPIAKPWGMDGIDPEFEFTSLQEDFDHFEPILEMALNRYPALADAGINLFFNGPESFTPDDRYMIGETPEVENLFVASGFNSIGIQSSGGVGKVVADWIRDRKPPMDLADVDIKRMMPFQSNKNYLHDRTVETLGLLYAMHWPYYQNTTARNARHTALHDRIDAAGAWWSETAGWERPAFFVPEGGDFEIEYSYGRQNWWKYVDAECKNMMENVALFDQSPFPKFLLQGKDSCAVLNRIMCNNVDTEIGKTLYTQMLNEDGGIEADVTVIRLDTNEFMIVTAGAAQTRDFSWIKKHIPEDAHAFLTDITSGLPMIGLMGPKSRALLEKLTGADLSNEAFPFGTNQELEMGYARVRLNRLTYVGELGWELYVPAEFAKQVYDMIVTAGKEFDLGHAGYFAMNACRSEKGYRHWGHDIAGEDTPVEAGLAFACDFEKEGGFIGKEAILAQKEKGVPCKRLVQIQLEDDSETAPLMYHEEPIYRNGEIVGSITSGTWGHRINKSIGMGYIHSDDKVTKDWIETGDFEIEIAWEKHKAKVQLAPWYDPKGERIKA